MKNQPWCSTGHKDTENFVDNSLAIEFTTAVPADCFVTRQLHVCQPNWHFVHNRLDQSCWLVLADRVLNRQERCINKKPDASGLCLNG